MIRTDELPRPTASLPVSILLAVLLGLAVRGAQAASNSEIDPRKVEVSEFRLKADSMGSLVPGAAASSGAPLPESKLQPSVGSGIALSRDGQFYGLTDRVPNAARAVDKGGDSQRGLPLAGLAPAIVRLRFATNSVRIEEVIVLRDREGAPLTQGSGGLDPEGLRCLPDGRFLVSEEHSPSLLVASPTGEVLMRYTPRSKNLSSANYPVKAILPKVFTQRRENRGFESLALSPDGKTAWLIPQSPLGNEGKASFAQSRLHRVLELDLSDPLAAKVTGMFLLPATPAGQLSRVKRQTQVKFTDAECLAPRKLLVLEQAEAHARLLIADLNAATNLLGRADAESLVFEESEADLARLGVRPAEVSLFLDLARLPAIRNAKLEGLAILGERELAVANDNDFGLGEDKPGEVSKVWRLRLPVPLPRE